MEEDSRVITDYEARMYTWVCEECGETTVLDEGVEPKKCYCCDAGKEHMLKNLQLEDLDNEEEYEYYCENCLKPFTSYLSENAKCPECHKRCDSPIETDYEMDYEPTEEEWEDI